MSDPSDHRNDRPPPTADGHRSDRPLSTSADDRPASESGDDQPRDRLSTEARPAAYPPSNVDGDGDVDVDSDHPVDPHTVPVWRWAALLGALPPAAAAGFFTLIATIARAPVAEFAWMAYPLLLAGLAALVFWYPGARYRRLRWRVDTIGITITDGIVWRTQSALPRVRIQHTDISQGPLQRKYGVATLKLYTAGSRFTRIELPGLAYADAVALRDMLIAPSDGDAV